MAYPAEDLHPMWTTLRFTWEDVRETYSPVNPEVFIHPADWEELGEPGSYNGAQVCRSIGIPRGTARIFCRQTLHYLPPIGPRWLDGAAAPDDHQYLTGSILVAKDAPDHCVGDLGGAAYGPGADIEVPGLADRRIQLFLEVVALLIRDLDLVAN